MRVFFHFDQFEKFAFKKRTNLIRFVLLFSYIFMSSCNFDLKVQSSGSNQVAKISAHSMTITKQPQAQEVAGRTFPPIEVTYYDINGQVQKDANLNITLTLLLPSSFLQFQTRASKPSLGWLNSFGILGSSYQFQMFGNYLEPSSLKDYKNSKGPVAGVTTFEDFQIPLVGEGYRLRFTNEDGLTLESDLVSILPDKPHNLVFLTNSLTVEANHCSPDPVEFKVVDQFGNISPLTEDTLIEIAGNQVSVYTDSFCTQLVTSIVLSSGESKGQYYFKATASGDKNTTLSSAGLNSDQRLDHINPSSASQLVFLSPSNSLTAGQCSSSVKIESQDSNGNPSMVDSDKVISLSGAGMTFYSAADCSGAPVSSVLLPNGNTQTQFYFKGTVAGSNNLNATHGTLSSQPQSQTILPGHAANLAFVVQPSSGVAGVPLSPEVQVKLVDSFGNLATSSNSTIQIKLATNSQGASLVGGPLLSMTTINGIAVFSVSTLLPQGIQVSKAGNGYQLIASASTMADVTSSPFNITGAGLDHFSFVTNSQTLKAGECSGVVTVEGRDTYNNKANLTANTTVSLSASGTTFFSDAGCATTVSSLSFSSVKNTDSYYFKGVIVGNPIPHNLTVSSGNAAPLVSQNHIIQSSTPVNIIATTSAQTTLAGSCSGAVDIKLIDTYNNDSFSSADSTFNLGATDGATTFYSDSACTPANSVTSLILGAGISTGRFYYKSTKSGSNTISYSSTNVVFGGNTYSISGSQVETILNASPDHLSYDVQPAQMVAGASFISAVKVSVRDVYENLCLNYSQPITISLSHNPSGSASIVGGNPSQVPTNGVSTFTGVSDIKIQKSDVGYSLAANSGSLAERVSATFEIKPANPTFYRYTAAPQASTVAGYCTALATITLEDNFGNLSPVTSNTNISYSTLPTGVGSIQFYSDSNCLTSANSQISTGQSSLNFYFKGKSAGNKTITLTPVGISCDAAHGCSVANTQSVVITPDIPFKLAWATNPIVIPNEVVAGECSPAIKLRSEDQYGNIVLVSGADQILTMTYSSGALFKSSNCDPGSQVENTTNSLKIADGTSESTFYFQTSQTGGGSFTVSAATYFSGVFAEATVSPNYSLVSQVEAMKAAPPDRFFIQEDTANSIAGQNILGSSGGNFKIELHDRFENLVAFSSAKAYVNIENYDTGSGPEVGTRSPLFGGTSMTSATTPTNAVGKNYFPTTPVASLWTNAIGGVFNFAGVQGLDIRKVGSYRLRVSALGIDYNSARALSSTFTVGNAPPSQLVYLTSPMTLTAGICSGAVTIQSQDPYFNQANVNMDTTITPSGIGMTFYSDSSCTQVITNILLSQNTNSVTFYFKGTTSSPTQALLVQASGGVALAQTTQNQVINPDVPYSIAYSTSSLNMTAGVCSSIITLQVKDQFNNNSPVTSDQNITLTQERSGVPDSTLSFYSNNSCTASIGSTATVVNGNSTVNFYAKGTLPGVIDLISTPLFRPAGVTTQSETLNPAPVSQIVYTLNEVQTLTAGDCSQVVQFQLQDSFNNLVKGSPTTVSFTSSQPGFTFYSDSSCSTSISNVVVPTNTTEGSYYFKGTVSGNRNLVATITSPSVSKTTIQNINPANFNRFSFTNGTSVISNFASTVGTCSAVVVEAQDSFGNQLASNLASQRVAFSTTAAGLKIFSDSICSPANELSKFASNDPDYPDKYYTDIINSKEAVVYLYNQVKGASTLSAFHNSVANSGTLNLQFDPDVATHLSFNVEPIQSIAGAVLVGQGNTTVKVALLDQFNNISNSTAPVLLSMEPTNSNNTGITLNGTLSVNGVGGIANFSTPSISKAQTNLSLKATSSGLTPITSSNFDVVPGIPTQIVFTSSPQNLSAGDCSGLITIQLKDVYSNNTLATSNVVIDLLGQGMTFYSDAGCSNSIAGNNLTISTGVGHSSFFFKSTKSGNIDLQASNISAPFLTAGQQTQSISPSTAAQIAVATSIRSNIVAGVCSGDAKVVTLEVQDQFGNKTSATSLYHVNLGLMDSAIHLYSDNACGNELTQNTGEYQFNIAQNSDSVNIFIKSEKSLNVPMTFTVVENSWTANQTQTVISDVPQKLNIISAPISGLVAGTCSSAVEVQIQDTYNNPTNLLGSKTLNFLSDASVSFYSDNGCTQPISSVTLSSGVSSTILYVISTTAANHTLQVTSTGLTTASQNINVTYNSAAKLSFNIEPTQTMAGEFINPSIEVEVLDAYNNRVTNFTGNIDLSLSVNPGSSTFGGILSVNAMSGVASFSDLNLNKSGTGYRILAQRSGLTSAQSSPFNIVANSPASLYFYTSAQTLDVKNCSGATMVGVRDSYDNDAVVSTLKLIQLSGTDLLYFSDSSCVNSITESAIASGFGQTQFWFKAMKSGSKTVNIGSMGLSSAQQIETIAPGAPTKLGITTAPQTVLSGECSNALNIQTQDFDGNESPVLGIVLVNLLGANYQFYSDSSCSNLITSQSFVIGESLKQIYFKGNNVGTFSMAFTSPGFSSVTQDQTIDAGHASVLKFISSSQNLLTDQCSSLVQFKVVDKNSNNTMVSAPLVVDLTPTGGLLFYSDSSCTQAISSVTIQPDTPSLGQSKGEFYFKTSSVVGNVNTKIEVYSTSSVVADRFKPNGFDLLQHRVNPRPPSQIDIASGVTSFQIASCSGAVTVSTQDSLGNLSDVTTGTTLNIHSNQKVQYYSDFNCQTPLSQVDNFSTTLNMGQGNSSVSFYPNIK